MNKPFHLLTAAEKTALRIAQNQAITERIAANKTVAPRAARVPVSPTGEGTRATPEERAKLGSGVIRKVQS